MTSEPTDGVAYRGVGFSREGVGHLTQGRMLSPIPAADIERIVLRHGLRSAHPVLQSAIGGVLIAVGAIDVLGIVAWLIHGGTQSAVSCRLLWLPVIGLWLLIDGLRRGYFLDVTAGGSRRKLAFDGGSQPGELRKAFELAGREFGYRVDDSILDRNGSA